MAKFGRIAALFTAQENRGEEMPDMGEQRGQMGCFLQQVNMKLIRNWFWGKAPK